jgi:hypothetical protein
VETRVIPDPRCLLPNPYPQTNVPYPYPYPYPLLLLPASRPPALGPWPPTPGPRPPRLRPSGNVPEKKVEFLVHLTRTRPGGKTQRKVAMIVTTKELFRHAYGNYALGAYNINNLEQTVGLFRGNLGKSNSNDDPVKADKSAPFILQISRGARS